MDELSKKLNTHFQGKVVRKDLTKKNKRKVNIRSNPINPDEIRTDKNIDQTSMMAISMSETKTDSSIGKN